MRLSLPLQVVAAALCGACGDARPAVDPVARPSVVLITLDTTRADHLGCYGRGLDVTPAIDALAAQGARFELCLATASVTPVSHASILTGRWPYEHGLRVLAGGGGDVLDAGVPTLAETLRDAGWSTGAFTSADTVARRYGLWRGFDVYDTGHGESFAADDPRRNANQRRADLTTDRAIAWLGETDGPVFLWLHFFDPHDPKLRPPDAFLQDFRARFSTVPAGVRPPAGYDAEVHYMDRQVARLLAALDATGRGDAAVALTADHGEGLGDHGWHAHRLLYQEQIRVPLILRASGVPAGVAVPHVVSTVDLAPTLAEVAGVPSPAKSGRSLLELARGREPAPRVVYADQLNALDLHCSFLDRRPQDDLLFTASDGAWKLIHRPNHAGQDELYHLAEDPGELQNRIADEPEVARRLLADLTARGAFRDAAFDSDSVDDDTRSALEGLGYVGGDDD